MPYRRCRGFGTRQLFRPLRRPACRAAGGLPCAQRLRRVSLSRAASRRALPRASGPPRSRSEAQRRCATPGSPQNSPIRSARSKSGSIRTCRSSARGAGPSASKRSRRRRSRSSGLMRLLAPPLCRQLPPQAGFVRVCASFKRTDAGLPERCLERD